MGRLPILTALSPLCFARLCVCGPRLVEINGIPVVSATLKELEDILLHGTSAQIVVLRQPPLALMSQQRPPYLGSDGEAVSTTERN